MSAEPEPSGRVTNSELRSEIRDSEFRMRRELRLTVALALLGGQVLASAVTALITRVGPVEQVHAIIAWLW